ncbi:hypothetical protein ACQ4M3_30955 [Leptolyngbya sp. AN03gr2]|uniref:hypothetical protein n=1 Tax=unclassified Leptolyngbya TaxID=2650499 RepID=UPI003D3195E8
MQVTSEALSPEAAQVIMSALPEKIQLGLKAYAAQVGQPIEGILEMMIAGFLDEDAISFANCQPLRGMHFI